MLTDFFWYPDLQYKDCHVHVGFHLNHIHFFLPIVYMWWAQVQSCLLPFPKDHQPLTCCLQYIIISTCFINNLKKTLPLLGPTAALAYNNVLYIILTNHTTIFYKNLFWSFTLQSTSFNNQTTSSLTTHLSSTSLTVFINWSTLQRKKNL